jgi:hypothetical protein
VFQYQIEDLKFQDIYYDFDISLNQYAPHWFKIEQVNYRDVKAVFWACYDCIDCPATLLVDKAEFLARKEFEFESKQ